MRLVMTSTMTIMTMLMIIFRANAAAAAPDVDAMQSDNELCTAMSTSHHLPFMLERPR